jgi:hypothetical protein
MTKPASLPTAFEALTPYLDWALPTETLRRRKRESSTMPEIQDFYDATLERVPEIMDHLRRTGSLATADAPTRTLYTLMLAFADASLSVELHKSPIVPDGLPGDVWKPEHETAGWLRKPAIVMQPARNGNA